MLGFAIRPDATAAAGQRFSAWLGREGGRIAFSVALIIGVALIARGMAGLLG